MNHITFDYNVNGTDYVCGDIHGCFDHLNYKLNQIGFNPTIDRLFVVGDLVDRGPHSSRVAEYIKKPWFFSVVGNHELMLIQSNVLAVTREERYHKKHVQSIWYQNGGDWWLNVDEDERNVIYDAVCTLPLTMEVSTKDGKRIGIVHASTASTWDKTVKIGTDLPSDRNQWDGPDVNFLTFSREKMRLFLDPNKDIPEESFPILDDIDLVVHGHTIIKHPIKLGNCLHIDTGLFLGKNRPMEDDPEPDWPYQLSIFTLDELLAFKNSPYEK